MKKEDRKGYSLFSNIVYSFRRLYEYSGKKYFFMLPLFFIGSVIVPLIIAVFPSRVITSLMSESSNAQKINEIFLFALAICISQVLVKQIEIKIKNTGFLFRLDLGKYFVRKNISIPYSEIEGLSGKEKYTKAIRAVYDGNDVGIEAIINLTNTMIINILGLIVYSIITAKLHPLLIILLVVCPLGRVIVLNSNKKWVDNNKSKWNKLEVKLDYLEKECLDIKHGKDIRIYNIEVWFSKLFLNLINKRFFWYKKEEIKKFNSELVERIMNFIRDVCCYGYLIYEFTQGLDIAQFTLYLGIISGFSTWVEKIVDSYSSLLDNNIVMDDYREYMEQKDYYDIGGNLKLPRSNTHSIRLENVSYTYPGNEKPVFENLNLEIKAKEKLALVGINGAGKTTLIKLICGLYKPDKGRILLDGIDITEFNLRDYYSLFSVVFQDVFAFAFTIEENITCSEKKNTDLNKLEKCINMSGLKEKIDSMKNGVNTNLLKDLEDDGVDLSGGQLQKLMLARALYKDSSILILDEPTAALDPIAESEMYEKYNSFAKEKTSIFISHRLSSTAFCDRIIFLNDGKIIEDGTHKELINLDGEYAKMFKIQSHYYNKEVEEDAC